MKKQVKVSSPVWFKAFLLTILLFTGATGFSAAPERMPSSCIIENLQRTGPSQGSVSYSWNSVSGATVYKVYYVRLSDSYTSPVYSTSSTYMPFSGLTAGTYRFYFAPVCGEDTLEYIADEVVII